MKMDKQLKQSKKKKKAWTSYPDRNLRICLSLPVNDLIHFKKFITHEILLRQTQLEKGRNVSVCLKEAIEGEGSREILE